MISIPYKAKQFGVFIIKLLIVIGAFYFIYDKLANDESLNWEKFWNVAQHKFTFQILVFLLFLSFMNRFLEIIKWKNLVTFIHPVSVSESTKQVLAALTAGIFTPNGIGEYAGKALYFNQKEAKTVIFLNLICNGVQMILSIIFGVLGLIVIGYWKWSLIITSIAILIFLFSFFSKKIKVKGYSIEKLISKINEIPKTIHRKNMLLALLRYLTFSHQYYFLFLVFGVDLPYITLMATIAVVYFLASSLPSFQFLDFAVKGSVAAFFFGKLDVSEWIVVFIATLMWFLNVVLPVVIGCFYVLKYKPKWNS